MQESKQLKELRKNPEDKLIFNTPLAARSPVLTTEDKIYPRQRSKHPSGTAKQNISIKHRDIPKLLAAKIFENRLGVVETWCLYHFSDEPLIYDAVESAVTSTAIARGNFNQIEKTINPGSLAESKAVNMYNALLRTETLCKKFLDFVENSPTLGIYDYSEYKEYQEARSCLQHHEIVRSQIKSENLIGADTALRIRKQDNLYSRLKVCLESSENQLLPNVIMVALLAKNMLVISDAKTISSMRDRDSKLSMLGGATLRSINVMEASKKKSVRTELSEGTSEFEQNTYAILIEAAYNDPLIYTAYMVSLYKDQNLFFYNVLTDAYLDKSENHRSALLFAFLADIHKALALSPFYIPNDNKYSSMLENTKKKFSGLTATYRLTTAQVGFVQSLENIEKAKNQLLRLQPGAKFSGHTLWPLNDDPTPEILQQFTESQLKTIFLVCMQQYHARYPLMPDRDDPIKIILWQFFNEHLPVEDQLPIELEDKDEDFINNLVIDAENLDQSKDILIKAIRCLCQYRSEDLEAEEFEAKEFTILINSHLPLVDSFAFRLSILPAFQVLNLLENCVKVYNHRRKKIGLTPIVLTSFLRSYFAKCFPELAKYLQPGITDEGLLKIINRNHENNGIIYTSSTKLALAFDWLFKFSDHNKPIGLRTPGIDDFASQKFKEVFLMLFNRMVSFQQQRQLYSILGKIPAVVMRQHFLPLPIAALPVVRFESPPPVKPPSPIPPARLLRPGSRNNIPDLSPHVQPQWLDLPSPVENKLMRVPKDEEKELEKKKKREFIKFVNPKMPLDSFLVELPGLEAAAQRIDKENRKQYQQAIIEIKNLGKDKKRNKQKHRFIPSQDDFDRLQQLQYQLDELKPYVPDSLFQDEKDSVMAEQLIVKISGNSPQAIGQISNLSIESLEKLILAERRDLAIYHQQLEQKLQRAEESLHPIIPLSLSEDKSKSKLAEPAIAVLFDNFDAELKLLNFKVQAIEQAKQLQEITKKIKNLTLIDVESKDQDPAEQLIKCQRSLEQVFQQIRSLQKLLLHATTASLYAETQKAIDSQLKSSQENINTLRLAIEAQTKQQTEDQMFLSERADLSQSEIQFYTEAPDMKQLSQLGDPKVVPSFSEIPWEENIDSSRLILLDELGILSNDDDEDNHTGNIKKKEHKNKETEKEKKETEKEVLAKICQLEEKLTAAKILFERYGKSTELSETLKTFVKPLTQFEILINNCSKNLSDLRARIQSRSKKYESLTDLEQQVNAIYVMTYQAIPRLLLYHQRLQDVEGQLAKIPQISKKMTKFNEKEIQSTLAQLKKELKEIFDSFEKTITTITSMKSKEHLGHGEMITAGIIQRVKNLENQVIAVEESIALLENQKLFLKNPQEKPTRESNIDVNPLLPISRSIFFPSSPSSFNGFNLDKKKSVAPESKLLDFFENKDRAFGKEVMGLMPEPLSSDPFQLSLSKLKEELLTKKESTEGRIEFLAKLFSGCGSELLIALHQKTNSMSRKHIDKIINQKKENTYYQKLMLNHPTSLFSFGLLCRDLTQGCSENDLIGALTNIVINDSTGSLLKTLSAEMGFEIPLTKKEPSRKKIEEFFKIYFAPGPAVAFNLDDSLILIKRIVGLLTWAEAQSTLESLVLKEAKNESKINDSDETEIPKTKEKLQTLTESSFLENSIEIKSLTDHPLEEEKENVEIKNENQNQEKILAIFKEKLIRPDFGLAAALFEIVNNDVLFSHVQQNIDGKDNVWLGELPARPTVEALRVILKKCAEYSQSSMPKYTVVSGLNSQTAWYSACLANAVLWYYEDNYLKNKISQSASTELTCLALKSLFYSTDNSSQAKFLENNHNQDTITQMIHMWHEAGGDQRQHFCSRKKQAWECFISVGIDPFFLENLIVTKSSQTKNFPNELLSLLSLQNPLASKDALVRLQKPGQRSLLEMLTEIRQQFPQSDVAGKFKEFCQNFLDIESLAIAYEEQFVAKMHFILSQETEEKQNLLNEKFKDPHLQIKNGSDYENSLATIALLLLTSLMMGTKFKGEEKELADNAKNLHQLISAFLSLVKPPEVDEEFVSCLKPWHFPLETTSPEDALKKLSSEKKLIKLSSAEKFQKLSTDEKMKIAQSCLLGEVILLLPMFVEQDSESLRYEKILSLLKTDLARFKMDKLFLVDTLLERIKRNDRRTVLEEADRYMKSLEKTKLSQQPSVDAQERNEHQDKDLSVLMRASDFLTVKHEKKKDKDLKYESVPQALVRSEIPISPSLLFRRLTQPGDPDFQQLIDRAFLVEHRAEKKMPKIKNSEKMLKIFLEKGEDVEALRYFSVKGLISKLIAGKYEKQIEKNSDFAKAVDRLRRDIHEQTLIALGIGSELKNSEEESSNQAILDYLKKHGLKAGEFPILEGAKIIKSPSSLSAISSSTSIFFRSSSSLPRAKAFIKEDIEKKVEKKQEKKEEREEEKIGFYHLAKAAVVGACHLPEKIRKNIKRKRYGASWKTLEADLQQKIMIENKLALSPWKLHPIYQDLQIIMVSANNKQLIEIAALAVQGLLYKKDEKSVEVPATKIKGTTASSPTAIPHVMSDISVSNQNSTSRYLLVKTALQNCLNYIDQPGMIELFTSIAFHYAKILISEKREGLTEDEKKSSLLPIIFPNTVSAVTFPGGMVAALREIHKEAISLRLMDEEGFIIQSMSTWVEAHTTRIAPLLLQHWLQAVKQDYDKMSSELAAVPKEQKLLKDAELKWKAVTKNDDSKRYQDKIKSNPALHKEIHEFFINLLGFEKIMEEPSKEATKILHPKDVADNSVEEAKKICNFYAEDPHFFRLYRIALCKLFLIIDFPKPAIELKWLASVSSLSFFAFLKLFLSVLFSQRLKVICQHDSSSSDRKMTEKSMHEAVPIQVVRKSFLLNDEKKSAEQRQKKGAIGIIREFLFALRRTCHQREIERGSQQVAMLHRLFFEEIFGSKFSETIMDYPIIIHGQVNRESLIELFELINLYFSGQNQSFKLYFDEMAVCKSAVYWSTQALEPEMRRAFFEFIYGIFKFYKKETSIKIKELIDKLLPTYFANIPLYLANEFIVGIFNSTAMGGFEPEFKKFLVKQLHRACFSNFLLVPAIMTVAEEHYGQLKAKTFFDKSLKFANAVSSLYSEVKISKREDEKEQDNEDEGPQNILATLTPRVLHVNLASQLGFLTGYTLAHDPLTVKVLTLAPQSDTSRAKNTVFSVHSVISILDCAYQLTQGQLDIRYLEGCDDLFFGDQIEEIKHSGSKSGTWVLGEGVGYAIIRNQLVIGFDALFPTAKPIERELKGAEKKEEKGFNQSVRLNHLIKGAKIAASNELLKTDFAVLSGPGKDSINNLIKQEAPKDLTKDPSIKKTMNHLTQLSAAFVNLFRKSSKDFKMAINLLFHWLDLELDIRNYNYRKLGKKKEAIIHLLTQAVFQGLGWYYPSNQISMLEQIAPFWHHFIGPEFNQKYEYLFEILFMVENKRFKDRNQNQALRNKFNLKSLPSSSFFEPLSSPFSPSSPPSDSSLSFSSTTSSQLH